MSQKQLQTLLGRKQEGPRPLGAAAAAYSPGSQPRRLSMWGVPGVPVCRVPDACDSA